jgi:hypothetical protein
MRTGSLGLYAALVAMTVGALSPGPAVAEPDSRAVAAIIAACSAKGAFGETFGAKSLTGKPGPRMVDSRIITPRAAYPLFNRFVALLTPNTERVAGVMAVAELADNDAALAWGRAILRAASRDPEQLSFPDALAPHEPGVPQVSVRGEVLEISCTDLALMDAVFEETNQKPRPPYLTDIAAPPADVCDRPETRKALLADFEEILGRHQENQVELSIYILRQAGWLAGQRELEWNPAWQDTMGSAATSAARRAKASYGLFEAARDSDDDATACAAAVRTLIAMDEAYKAQLAHRDAREAEIAGLARSAGKEAGDAPPSP